MQQVPILNISILKYNVRSLISCSDGHATDSNRLFDIDISDVTCEKLNNAESLLATRRQYFALAFKL